MTMVSRRPRPGHSAGRSRRCSPRRCGPATRRCRIRSAAVPVRRSRSCLHWSCDSLVDARQKLLNRGGMARCLRQIADRLPRLDFSRPMFKAEAVLSVAHDSQISRGQGDCLARGDHVGCAVIATVGDDERIKQCAPRSDIRPADIHARHDHLAGGRRGL